MDTTTLPKLFTVIFEDGSNFLGGMNYSDTKWLEIPNKKIKRLFYRLSYRDFLCLSDYDKYYHMIEATKDLNGSRRGEVRIEYVYLMGRLGTKITVYKINLKNNENYITKKEFDINDNWIKKLNSNGWK